MKKKEPAKKKLEAKAMGKHKGEHKGHDAIGAQKGRMMGGKGK